MAKPIGTLGTIDTLTVGGRVFTDLVNIIVLGGYITTNTNSCLRKSNGAAGYAVTSGKTLTISAVRAQSGVTLSATEGVSGFSLAQADVDVGLDSASALTNPVYDRGTASFRTAYLFSAAGQNNVVDVGGISLPVLATKYLAVNGSSTAMSIMAFGYEA